MTGTYDPELNLLFVGTGNPTPVLNGEVRPGDNPWTCAIVALNPDTGKLEWGFQASPHDTHDWDAAEVPVLVDAPIGDSATPRKLLLQASRNGYYFVLDRTTGKSLRDQAVRDGQLGEGDRQGRAADAGSRRRSRSATDGWSRRTKAGPPTIDRRASIRARACSSSARVDAYGIYFFKPEHGAYGWAGANSSVWSRAALRAIDYQTGDVRWSHDIGEGGGSAGVLTTATGLTFTGDTNNNAARAAHQRRRHAVALGDRARRQFADHVRARRASVPADRRRQRALRLRASGRAGRGAVADVGFALIDRSIR